MMGKYPLHASTDSSGSPQLELNAVLQRTGVVVVAVGVGLMLMVPLPVRTMLAIWVRASNGSRKSESVRSAEFSTGAGSIVGLPLVLIVPLTSAAGTSVSSKGQAARLVELLAQPGGSRLSP